MSEAGLTIGAASTPQTGKPPSRLSALSTRCAILDVADPVATSSAEEAQALVAGLTAESGYGISANTSHRLPMEGPGHAVGVQDPAGFTDVDQVSDYDFCVHRSGGWILTGEDEGDLLFLRDQSAPGVAEVDGDVVHAWKLDPDFLRGHISTERLNG